MTEPTRLLATPESELERALLDAGRSYTGSPSLRAKTLVSLGLTGVGTTSVAAASSTLSKGALSKLAVAVLVLGGIAVPVWRYLEGNARHAPVALAPVVSATQALPAPAAPVTPSPADLQAPAAAPSPSITSVARVEPRPASPPPLAAELAALDAARTSLSRSDPSAALVALDSYSRNFPRGRLSIEAEVLRIGALAKSGQTDAARKRAEAFLLRHPDSVLAARVRSYAGL